MHLHLVQTFFSERKPPNALGSSHEHMTDWRTSLHSLRDEVAITKNGVCVVTGHTLYNDEKNEILSKKKELVVGYKRANMATKWVSPGRSGTSKAAQTSKQVSRQKGGLRPLGYGV